MYQWKLLNHVSREHNMTLKPAHLSYKCTVCTATFGMYKQFENHVYSAHSTVAKKSNDTKSKSSTSSSSGSVGNSSRSSLMVSGAGASILKQPFKINDEITITPQPASRNNRPIEIESHVIGECNSKKKKRIKVHLVLCFVMWYLNLEKHKRKSIHFAIILSLCRLIKSLRNMNCE